MRFLRTTAPCFLLALALGSPSGWCQSSSIKADVPRPGAKISPTLYGIFFEEINHAGDGGIYAELMRNRTFEEKTTLACSDISLGGSADPDGRRNALLELHVRLEDQLRRLQKRFVERNRLPCVRTAELLSHEGLPAVASSAPPAN